MKDAETRSTEPIADVKSGGPVKEKKKKGEGKEGRIKGRRKGKSEREIAGCAENLSWSVSGTGSGVKFC